MQHFCPVCDGPIPLRRTGRPRVYCTAACRQRADRQRRAALSERAHAIVKALPDLLGAS